MTARTVVRLGAFAVAIAAFSCASDGEPEVVQTPDGGSDASSGGSAGAATGGAAGAAGGGAGGAAGGGGVAGAATGGAAGAATGGAAGAGTGGASGADGGIPIGACDQAPNSCVPPNASCPAGSVETAALGCAKKNHKCCVALTDGGSCKPSGAPCTKNEECCTPVCLPTGCWNEA